MNRRRFLAGSIALPLAAFEAQWDVDGQKQRRQTIDRLHAHVCGPLFSADGGWIGPATESTGRVRFWHSMSLLEIEATRDKANAVIRKCFEDRGKLTASFSHFEYCAAAQLLAKQKDKLAPDNRKSLAALLKEALAHQAPIYFRGYNDNFPAMENVTALLGGEEVDDAPARQRGLEGMRRLLKLFERRGLLSEYTSSTYTPVTQLCYADIAEYSHDPEARRLALEIEGHIWLDLATHFHAPTNILAGPHSRAYNVDSVGHLYQVHMLLYQVFGDKVWLNPVHFLFPPVPKQVIHHDGDVAFMQASDAWIASGTYHPSAGIERLLFQKAYPARVSATSEFGTAEMPVMTRGADGKFQATDGLLEYPCGELVSTSYQTEDYAVGSATCQFHDGNQTDTFFVNFKRAERPASLEDTGTIFCRYACNGDGPGVPWHDPRNQTGERSTDLFADSGRVRTVQKDNTVLALYQSKAQFLDDYSVLRLVLAVPVFYRSLRRVTIGDGAGANSVTPDIVWIEEDYLYAAFRPLLLTNHGRRFAVSVHQDNGYLAISFYNYDGPARRFSRKELLRTFNGFVAEIGSKREYGSFDRFRSHVLGGRVEEVVADGQRITKYSREGTELALCHSLYFGGIKYALVDGKAQRRPQFEATGVS
ncbi:MAG TPA: hypothetical protein VGL97_00775 [Bryobacteraceae bacterium]|jgi:hypothetical protein